MKTSHTLRMTDEAWAALLVIAKKEGYRGRGEYIEALVKQAQEKEDD